MRDSLGYADKAVPAASQSGIAILMVLWAITVLMVIVLSFSFTTSTETHSTLSFRVGIENKFLAEAGIERGIMEVFYRQMYRGQEAASEGMEVWNTDGTSYIGQLGVGNYSASIRDEAGKIGLNTLTDLSVIILKNLLTNSGVSTEDADIIGDSILDWTDTDDAHREHGAESDYYMSLPNPYKAKDGPFDTVEELLLVRGMTPEILYGYGEKRGIIDFVTVHSKANTINILAAPKEVLMAIPGISPEDADEIIGLREADPKNTTAISPFIGKVTPPFNQFVSMADTGNAYTIEAVGYKEDENKGYGIRATVTIDSNNKFTYVYYKSPAVLRRTEISGE